VNPQQTIRRVVPLDLVPRQFAAAARAIHAHGEYKTCVVHCHSLVSSDPSCWQSCKLLVSLIYLTRSHYNEDVGRGLHPARCIRVLLALAALLMVGDGCRQQPPESSPEAVTIAYVGGYRGFHRPCG
jgi:hypothetical protein